MPFDYGGDKMLAKFPPDSAKLSKVMMDRELLRLGIIAELDAIDLYEQLASATEDKMIKTVFLDIAKEEKTHVGEFLTLLLEKDEEQTKELAKGKEEIMELSSK